MQTLLQAVVAFLLIIQAGNYPSNVKQAAITIANDALASSATSTVGDVTQETVGDDSDESGTGTAPITTSTAQSETDILAQIATDNEEIYTLRGEEGAAVRSIMATKGVGPTELDAQVSVSNQTYESQIDALQADITTLQNEY